MKHASSISQSIARMVAGYLDDICDLNDISITNKAGYASMQTVWRMKVQQHFPQYHDLLANKVESVDMINWRQVFHLQYLHKFTQDSDRRIMYAVLDDNPAGLTTITVDNITRLELCNYLAYDSRVTRYIFDFVQRQPGLVRIHELTKWAIYLNEPVATINRLMLMMSLAIPRGGQINQQQFEQMVWNEAIKYDRQEIIEYLKEDTPIINKTELLHTAVRYNRKFMIDFLLQNDESLRSEMLVAFHLSLICKRYESIDLLLPYMQDLAQEELKNIHARAINHHNLYVLCKHLRGNLTEVDPDSLAIVKQLESMPVTQVLVQQLFTYLTWNVVNLHAKGEHAYSSLSSRLFGGFTYGRKNQAIMAMFRVVLQLNDIDVIEPHVEVIKRINNGKLYCDFMDMYRQGFLGPNACLTQQDIVEIPLLQNTL